MFECYLIGVAFKHKTRMHVCGVDRFSMSAVSTASFSPPPSHAFPCPGGSWPDPPSFFLQEAGSMTSGVDRFFLCNCLYYVYVPCRLLALGEKFGHDTR